MSTNLTFRTKVGGHDVDFPYQTSTNFTYEVLSENNREIQEETAIRDTQKKMVIKDILSKNWDDETKTQVISKVVRLFKDDTLELSCI